jgi:hypothetical protein
VVSTSQPLNLFDSAMSTMPRIRDWRFSSVMSGARPAKLGASISSKAAWAGSMGMTRGSMPSSAHSFSASVREWSEE